MKQFLGEAVSRDILSIFLIFTSLPLVSGLTETQTIPLPVFSDITYDFRDVIVKPTSATSLTLNVTLYDMETNTTVCNLMSSMVTDFYLFAVNEDCEEELRPGLAIVSRAEVDVYISFSGNKSPIPALHKMGVKYIFPEDFDKHQTDRTTSLLIYAPVRNTTVDLCGDHLNVGHLSVEFTSEARKWFDGTLKCYRANLARGEMWMINNASLPGGIEVNANNPVAVLCGHLSNISHAWKNGQFMDGSEAPGTQIIWDILPPLKFWGKQFMLFPREDGVLKNVFVIAEHNSNVSFNSPQNQEVFNIPGKKVWSLAVPLSNSGYVTLSGTSKMTVFSYDCLRQNSSDLRVRHYDAVDSSVKFNYSVNEAGIGINIICSNIMQTWLLSGSNSSVIYPNAHGKTFFGNRTVYHATFSYANRSSVIYVNLTADDCFLQRPIQSDSGIDPSCIHPNRPETIENISRAVKFDNSHQTNVSEKDLSGMGSKVVIGVHINDNVNKSSTRNVSDMSLYGNKTENSSNRSDIKVPNNQTKISYLLTTKIDQLLAHTTLSKAHNSTSYEVTSNSSTERFVITSTSTSTTDHSRWSPKVLKAVTNPPIKTNEHKSVTTSRMDISSSGTSDSFRWSSKVLYILSNISNETKGYQTTASSRSAVSTARPQTNVTNSDSGTSAEIDGSTVSYRTDQKRQLTTDIQNKIINESGLLDSDRSTSRTNHLSQGPVVNLSNHSSEMISRRNEDSENESKSLNGIDIIQTKRISKSNQTGDKHVYSGIKGMSINSTETKNVSNTAMQNNNTKHSRNRDPYSNNRFKVVLDMISTGSKGSNANTRMRYDEKNPSYTHEQSDQGTLEQVGDGKSLVAVIVSLSSALFAVIAIILVFFFIEYFSRRKQIRKTRIRPFLSDF